jgi:hypothetical protein
MSDPTEYLYTSPDEPKPEDGWVRLSTTKWIRWTVDAAAGYGQAVGPTPIGGESE